MSSARVHDHAPPRPAIGARRAEEILALAAAPAFALMALLNATVAADPASVICSAAGMSPVSGMLTMYGLMAALHLGPWLRLVRASRPVR